jgi:hypothetical protein
LLTSARISFGMRADFCRTSNDAAFFGGSSSGCTTSCASCVRVRSASSHGPNSSKCVRIRPFPLIDRSPRSFHENFSWTPTADTTASEHCMQPGNEVDSILDAVLTVSPKKQ